MRIVIDLDGTICAIKQPGQSYAELAPVTGAAEKLRELRHRGHYIIIHTARNMATCESNLGKVMKNVGLITLQWLEKHGIEYDELWFGKPNAEVYLDDRGIRFTGWDQITEEKLLQESRPR